MSDMDKKIAVIGLGYVGLPLAVEFGKHRPVIGFDIKPDRIAELRAGRDQTREVSPEELAEARHLALTADPADLSAATIFIVTVPTPIDGHKRPDLTPLLKASETVGRTLKKGDIVIYESTVYPGATEEDCVPVLERVSGLTYNVDFFCGYSPERINPGDKAHRLTTIRKVTSGSTPEVAEVVDSLYASIVSLVPVDGRDAGRRSGVPIDHAGRSGAGSRRARSRGVAGRPAADCSIGPRGRAEGAAGADGVGNVLQRRTVQTGEFPHPDG
jgi:nucleotide sugar dehydrogenase